METKTKTSTSNGIRTVEEVCPDGWEIVDTYNPCSSVTPWDCYGRSHQKRCRKALQAAGIDSISLQASRTILHPMGSGPGGSVRFGDSMTPGTYQTAVPEDKAGAARQVIRKG